METKKIFCKGCSNGCPLEVEMEDGMVAHVTGNCCHRGIVSAKKQLEPAAEEDLSNYTGTRRIACSRCPKCCRLEVIMKEGKVYDVYGGRCKRADADARKQLEK